MKRTLLLAGLWVIAIASILEIILYFTAGRSLGLKPGIPGVSDIFSPVVLSPYVKQFEETKTFYPQRLNGFTNDFGSVVSAKSSFVKSAEAAYVVGGTVTEVSPVEGQGEATGYDITLKNFKGDTFLEHISSQEAQYVKITSPGFTSTVEQRANSALTNIKTGDYIAIRRSTNLLNSAEINIDINILTRGR